MCGRQFLVRGGHKCNFTKIQHGHMTSKVGPSQLFILFQSQPVIH
jgi:hypothetical protein